MENLEQKIAVLNLGKLFVKQLGLEKSCDTLSRWMAHYLAEKMTLAEQLVDKEKEKADKEVFEIILDLWKQRWLLRRGDRPLENFEPILEILKRIDPSKETPYYFNITTEPGLSDLKNSDADVQTLTQWLDIAREMDKVARIWIEYALQKAASNAKNETTEEWLKNGINMPESLDTEIIFNILYSDESAIDPLADNDIIYTKKRKRDRTKKKIEHLEKFVELSTILLKTYKEEIERSED